MWREDAEEQRKNCKYRSQTVYQGNNHVNLNISTQNNSLVCTVHMEEAENNLTVSVSYCTYVLLFHEGMLAMDLLTVPFLFLAWPHTVSFLHGINCLLKMV